MKKFAIVALTAMLVLVSLSSCTTTEYVEVEKPVDMSVVEVATFEEFAKTVTHVQEGQTVRLTADILWDGTIYSENCSLISPYVTWTLDLNGKAIKNYVGSALALNGNVDILNGTIEGNAVVGGEGCIVLVNSNGSTSGMVYNRDQREDYSVRIENITTVNCGFRVELSTCSFFKCNLQNAGNDWKSNVIQSTGCYMTIARSTLNQVEPDSDEKYTAKDCLYSNGYAVNYIAADVVLEGNKRVYTYKNSITYVAPGITTSTMPGTASYKLPVEQLY